MLTEMGKITSLYEIMVKFPVDAFYRMGRKFENFAEMRREQLWFWPVKRLNIPGLWGSLSGLCQTAGLTLASDKCEELSREKWGVFSSKKFGEEIYRVNWMIEHELKNILFFQIEQENAGYFKKDSAWEAIISRKGFESIQDEVDSASLALGTLDYTGAVFHLMRIMEFGFSAIGKDLGRTFGSREWGKMLNVIEGYFQHKYSVGDNSWEKKEPEWVDILSSLRLVKDAWRNKISHVGEMDVDTFYKPERAKLIYRHVQDFMDRLSLHLNPRTP